MDKITLQDRLNLETAKIPWHEIQPFFAAGNAIHVANGLDLIDVAYRMADDDTDQLKPWIENHLVSPVSDEKAQKWYNDNTSLWAVVIKPWVLVQTC